MSLTHQFLITLSLPAAFVALLLYDWRLARSRQYGPYWSLTLLVAAVWSSSLLSYYAGVTLPAEIAMSWRIAARHTHSALAFFLLWTTTAYLNTSLASRRLLLAVSAFFWSVALFLDPAIWPYRLPAWSGATPQSTHFSVWSAIWVTAWIIPLVAAVLLTRQASREALSALYRNRLNYWLATLILFGSSGALALVQQPGQPAWQELGALGFALAAILGTATLTLTSLPNLWLALRHVVARLAASLLILALTWLFLFLFVNSGIAQGRPSTVLELGLAAAIFTALFGAINRYVPSFIRRWLLPQGRSRSGAIADEPALTTVLPNPAALAEILLRLSQFNIATESARLLLVEEEDEGTIRLRAVAHVGQVTSYEPMEIMESSAIASHLRQHPPTPLSTYELESLPVFSATSSEEKEQLQQGDIEIFMPLVAGDELVGVLALGEKYTGESYSHSDLVWLQDIGRHGGLLLWQAKELQQAKARLESTCEEMQALQRETHRLRELLALHERLASLISPRLRQPFGQIHSTVEDLQSHYEGNGAAAPIVDLNRHLAQLRLMLNNLIVSAARVRRQRDFSFTVVDVMDIVYEAVRDLDAMAAARQVTVSVRADTHLPRVEGDAERLYEAMLHLLHNAIKFNKIGGSVEVKCGATDKQLFLHVRDSGVGIPSEQLATIWQGAALAAGEQPGSYGSGLGLMLTQFIIRAHGGYVQASSNVDRGSTFSLYLPLATSESVGAVPA